MCSIRNAFASPTTAHAHTHVNARGWTRGVVGDARAEGSSYAAPAGADRPALRATLTSLSQQERRRHRRCARAIQTRESGRLRQMNGLLAQHTSRAEHSAHAVAGDRRGLCPVAATAGALEAFVRNRECAAAALVPLSDGDGLPFVDDADTRRASVGGRHAAGTLWRQFLCGGCATFGRRRLHTVTPLC